MHDLSLLLCRILCAGICLRKGCFLLLLVVLQSESELFVIVERRIKRRTITTKDKEWRILNYMLTQK